MTTHRPRERGQGQRRSFLDGPAVAALFRAVRHVPVSPEALPPRNFAVPPGAGDLPPQMD